MPYLVAFGTVKRDLFELTKDPVVVGRERKATLSLSDFQVSRRHAEITCRDDGYYVRDLGSRNGFFHNRMHIKRGEGIELDHGDELVLGRTGLRFYKKDPGDVESLTAPIIPELLKNLPNTRPESPTKQSASKKTISDRDDRDDRDETHDGDEDEELLDSNVLEDADDSDRDELVSDDGDAGSMAQPEDLDSEVLQYAAGPGSKKGPELLAKRPRYTELSEEIEDDKRSGGSKKNSARNEAESPAPGKGPEKKAEKAKTASARRKKKSTRRAASLKTHQSSRPKRAGSGRHSARQAVAAEVQTLRTLLDRTERERLFYRRLTVVMVIFLMLLVSLLFVKMLSGGEQVKIPEVKSSTKKKRGSSPKTVIMRVPENGLKNAAKLHAGTFNAHVLPWLKANCKACHGVSGASSFRMDFDNSQQAIAIAANYVIPGYPDRSFLVQKPLSIEEGGVVHGGGDLLAVNTLPFQKLKDWISKVKTAKSQSNQEKTDDNGQDDPDLSPLAKIEVSKTLAAVGDRIVLDSGSSVSKTNSTLLVTWTLIIQPTNSRAVIEDDGAQTTGFTPDVEGRYTVQLLVQDGSLSNSESVLIKVDPNGSAAEPGAKKINPGAQPAKPKPKEIGPSQAEVAPIFRKLTGQDISSKLYKKVKDKTLRKTARKILKLTDSKIYLLRNELPTFALDGNSKPPDFYLKLIAKQLGKDEGFTIRDALVELAISPYFNSKNSDAKSYARALFQAFLKRKAKGAERAAVVKMYDGKEAKLFKVKGRGQAEAAGILASQPGFVKDFLARCYKFYMAKDADQNTIDAALLKYQGDQTLFFKIVEAWVVPRKS
jgi:predicted component of type VI protein secretion system